MSTGYSPEEIKKATDRRTTKTAVVILTKNEEKNLAACLDSVAPWTTEIFVVDSHSTDRTVEVARGYGARVIAHSFESHARQWNWALRNLPIRSAWVLGLDADQRVTPELAAEIGQWTASPTSASVNGCYLRRKQVFRSKWIRHGGYYPKYLLKLFRLQAARVDDGDRVDHHFSVDGPVVKLKSDIIEDNQNEADLTAWIEKHSRYALLQAMEEHERSRARLASSSAFGNPDQRTLWLKGIWSRLPLYIRPALLFIYRYFFHLGFLDGKQGFIFHFMQSFWYRLLVDIRLDELRSVAADHQATGNRAIESPVQKSATRPSLASATTEAQENIV